MEEVVGLVVDFKTNYVLNIFVGWQIYNGKLTKNWSRCL